jgi:type VI secretion system secreted protein VgrG
LEPRDFYSIRITSADLPPLTVARIEGREAMNELSSLDVVVYTLDADEVALERALLGAQAIVSIEVPRAGPRNIAGIIIDVAILGRTEGARHGFRLRLAPRAWLLTKRVGSRIFQDRTVLEVAAIVLAEHRIPYRASIVGRYPIRDYCVQYQESDWDFLVRLFAEEAFFFWFEQPIEDAAPELLVVADSPGAYGVLPGGDELRFRYDQGGSMVMEEDMVTDFRSRVGLETSAFTMRDYDFERPGLDLASAQSAAEAPPAPLGGASLEHYEHHGEYEETDVDVANVRAALEQLRARSRTAQGRSACRRLAPGLTFALVDHDVPALDRRYVVTAVSHEGVAPKIAGEKEPYRNIFQAVPAEVGHSLPRPPRRVRQTLESAVVVGPAGHEIHCDRYGRIRVQFHWDRDGRLDERSSCFLRVAQAWSGTDFGHQLVPRIGMEVLVSFLGGDPDRPVVIGCVPNAHNPPQYSLPSSATRSGIRTRSSPGGGGFNELAFEDRAGQELVYLRAQRNLEEEVGLDRTEKVGREKKETIGADLRATVGRHRYDATTGDHQVSVGGARSATIGGAERAIVGGVRSTSVAGSDLLRVAGSLVAEIGADRSARIAGRDEIRIGGDRLEVVEGADTRAVHGPVRLTCSDACVVNAAGGVSLSVGSKKKPASAEGTLSGDLALRGEGAMEISSARTIRLRVGQARLTLGPEELRIEAKKISLSADTIEAIGEKGALSVGKELILKGDAVRLASRDNAVLELDQEAKLDGQAVKIKPGLAAEMAKREERAEQAKDVEKRKITLFDLTGHPIENAPYEVSFFGYLDEGVSIDGTVEIPLYPEVESATLRWGRPVERADDPDAEDPYEQQMEIYLKTDVGDPDETLRRKLHNLGHRGRDLASAVRHYQRSSGLPPTGRADDVRADVDARHGSANPAKLSAARGGSR